MSLPRVCQVRHEFATARLTKHCCICARTYARTLATEQNMQSQPVRHASSGDCSTNQKDRWTSAQQQQQLAKLHKMFAISTKETHGWQIASCQASCMPHQGTLCHRHKHCVQKKARALTNNIHAQPIWYSLPHGCGCKYTHCMDALQISYCLNYQGLSHGYNQQAAMWLFANCNNDKNVQ